MGSVRLVWLEGSSALSLAPEEVEMRLLESAAAAEAASAAAGLALDALTPLEQCASEQGTVLPAVLSALPHEAAHACTFVEQESGNPDD